jgi:DNA-binding transcriptional ArsR family regulator
MGVAAAIAEQHPTEFEVMAANAGDASRFLKAIAHQSRLLILCILCEGEKSVTELERLLALRQPTVSQQLARLRTERLVNARRDGKTIYYSLASDDVRIIIDAVHRVFCGRDPRDERIPNDRQRTTDDRWRKA